jgi:nicotinate (nicotinamide) nucleotide adenylyltransferase
MKKGILGGTFDPIHNGHLSLAKESLKYLELDTLIFMPNGNPPHKKDKKITAGEIRCELIDLAIKGIDKLQISTYELYKNNLSYTFETVEYLKKVEPETEWFFITGADCLNDLHLWKNVERMLNACTLVVFNRPGYDKKQLINKKNKFEQLYNKKIIFMEFLLIDISSSYIRSIIKLGEDAQKFLPDGVYSKIKELGLYKSEEI